jgi:hypothetical protein
MVVRGSTNSGQQTVVNKQWSTNSGQQTVVNKQWSTNSGQQTVVNNQWSTNRGQPWSTVVNSGQQWSSKTQYTGVPHHNSGPTPPRPPLTQDVPDHRHDGKTSCKISASIQPYFTVFTFEPQDFLQIQPVGVLQRVFEHFHFLHQGAMVVVRGHLLHQHVFDAQTNFSLFSKISNQLVQRIAMGNFCRHKMNEGDRRRKEENGGEWRRMEENGGNWKKMEEKEETKEARKEQKTKK